MGALPGQERTAAVSSTLSTLRIWLQTEFPGKTTVLPALQFQAGQKPYGYRWENSWIILCIRIFHEGLYDFSCVGLLTGTRRERHDFAHSLSRIQNGRTAFRFVRLAVRPRLFE